MEELEVRRLLVHVLLDVKMGKEDSVMWKIYWHFLTTKKSAMNTDR